MKENKSVVLLNAVVSNCRLCFASKSEKRNTWGFTRNCHPEFISGSTPLVIIQNKEEMLKQVQHDNRRGFTLIELLVVVLIISILAAVAVPQYQKAVLKSRFSKLMLPAKSLAQANEAYYLANGVYANRPNQLDVGSDTNNLPDGTTLLIGDNAAISFVQLANAQQVPNARYVVYQNRSANFPATTMCEAFDEDDKATWLCEKGLNGTKMETGNSGQNIGWSAYLLTGDGTGGKFPPVDIQASQSKALGHAVWEDGEWKYEWSDGNSYGVNQRCTGDSAYACAGGLFNKYGANCQGNNANACASTTFTGGQSYCRGNKEEACANSHFNGGQTRCQAYEENACIGSIFRGDYSYCVGYKANACAGITIEAGTFCYPGASKSCNGVLYGTHPEKGQNVIGSCREYYNNCPNGVPINNFGWNSETRSYNIVSWKGGYCDASAMASGVCPNGSPTGSSTNTTDKTTSAGWYGGYCDPTISGTCPSGSPSGDYTNGPDGQCWDGSGNRVAC